ncbi:MAG: SDR family NAD(P)-dependent oxidoreductase [Thaumarchaeota archaeon]|nr:SDR family NAD(P)-dependent oxidoreductase [Nitrososphaerota archaeon]
MMDSAQAKTILVIGATGGIGRETARAFLQAGWTVRALARKPEAAAKTFGNLVGVKWLKGDAMQMNDVIRAAEGAAVIFHGANPPDYVKWRELAIPMLANTIEVARKSGARLLFPANIYLFGPDSWPLISETSPQHPLTEKGAIRLEMENMIVVSGLKSLVVRGGDFFGGHAPGSWLQNAMVKPGKAVRSVTYPGRHDAGHSWAYLPDLAQTFLKLTEREGLGAQENFHFRGHYFENGVEMARAIARAAGNENMKVTKFPWALIRLLSPFKKSYREIMKMRYLWQETIELDNTKLVAFLGEEPHTPLDAALTHTLRELGCLGTTTKG